MALAPSPEAITLSPDAIPLPKVIGDSIQDLPNARKEPNTLEFWSQYGRGPILPAWGTHERERVLRRLHHHDYSWMWKGAVSGIIKTIASTPFEITAPEVDESTKKYYRHAAKAAGLSVNLEDSKDPQIEYYEQVLIKQADFGRGFASLVSKFVKDYLRQDLGGIVEVIAPGKASGAPKGAVSGVAVLDSLRCYPTGDPVYPFVYYNRKNKYHLIHNSRVLHFQDAPDSDETRLGYGECALSRAVSITYREILMGRYIEGTLDDKPPPGVVVASGLMDLQREQAVKTYKQDMSQDEQPLWGKQLWFFSKDPTMPISLEMQSFAQPPEKFDFKLYTELDVDAICAAIGIDRQELWQLTGQGLGSGAQSATLEQKSRGKLVGLLMADIERKFSSLMPEGYKATFKRRNPQEDKENAENAKSWAGVATSLKGDLSADERRELLAQQIPAIEEIITDENGDVIGADEAGVEPPEVTVANIGANARLNANNENGGGGAVKPGGANRAVRKPPDTRAQIGRRDYADSSNKAIQSTRIEFEDAFSEAIDRRQKNKMTAARFGIIGRDLLRKYGLQGMRDGLEDGGVSPYDETGAPLPLSPEDQTTYTHWLAEQSYFVTRLSNELNTTDEMNADYRASLWGNKSLMSIYQAGIVSADKNGMYRWDLGKTEKHCKDCARLNGQVHRIKDYQRRKLLPNSEILTCGGYQCDCRLTKTTERAKGRF